MTIRDIIIAPDPRLKVKSAPVDEVTDETRTLMDDMLETMYDAPGIGLAAVQIGVPLRIIVIDLAHPEDDEEPAPLFLVNPQIIERSGELRPYDEGCLSLPDFYENVERPNHVILKYQDYDGTHQELEASEMLATCVQHEMDHLEGVLFVDHLSKMKRAMILRKLTKQKRLDEVD